MSYLLALWGLFWSDSLSGDSYLLNVTLQDVEEVHFKKGLVQFTISVQNADILVTQGYMKGDVRFTLK